MAEPVLSVSEPAHPGQVDLRIEAGEAEALGVRLPRERNSWLAYEGQEVLWLGPDEWLVVSTGGGTGPEIAADLRARLAGGHASAVEVSANRAVVDLGGHGRFEVLSQGCSLDLDPREWRPGMCAQTLLARVPVILQERDTGTRVFVRPSYLSHFSSWLDGVVR